MIARRLPNNPIITPKTDESIGENINGPSLIKTPDWISNALGKYYLYFAHHQGDFIRLAYADDLAGPWKIFKPGVFSLENTVCRNHIASPDLHVDNERRQFVMYFHGPTRHGHRTFRAVSKDGLCFTAEYIDLGPSYMRVFQHEGMYYAIGNSGVGKLLRSEDGVSPFEEIKEIFPRQRHVALLKKGETLYIFLSRGEDCPEHIMLSQMSLKGDCGEWEPTEPVTFLMPEFDWEGANEPLAPSKFGAVHTPVRQLRDPAIFEEDGKTYLLYSVAGEHGIAIAEIIE